MRDGEYIAALDLGTSKMVIAAAQKNYQNMLTILASEKIDSEKCVRRACIYNIDGTGEKVRKLIRKMDTQLKNKIEKVYVGIGGQSLHSETYSVTRSIGGEIITKTLIDSLWEECRQFKHDLYEVLEIIPPEFYVNGQIESNPVGIVCNTIEARFTLILGNPSLKANLERSIEKGYGKIAGCFISPIASAEAVLIQREKELGCALVEFGAGVTYVSIYNNGALRYLATIPLGSSVITKDLCDLNILESEAEKLKIGEEFDGCDVDMSMVDTIIEARIDEIVDNIIEQIRRSGYATSLEGGIAATGGGAIMNELRALLSKKTNIKVRLAATKKTLVNTHSEIAGNQANSTLTGLLALGQENCAKENKVVEPVPSGGGLFDDEITPVEPKKNPEEKANAGKKKKEKTPGGFFSKIGFSKKIVDNITGLLFDDEEMKDDEEKESNNTEENNKE